MSGLIPPVGIIKSVRSNAPSTAVSEFHLADDVDAGLQAHHHTLGKNPNQAAAGNHDHKLEQRKLTRIAAKVVGNANVLGGANVWTNLPVWTFTIPPPTKIVYGAGSGAFTINDPGYYVVKFNLGLIAAGATVGAIRILKNGVSVVQNNNDGGLQGMCCAWEDNISAGDVIQPQGFSNVAANAIEGAQCFLTIRKVSEQFTGDV